jgi:AcrR family transcriptional regulator
MDGPAIIRRQPFGGSPHVGEAGAKTEARICQAALAAFAEVGFDAASVDLIATYADCSRPAFYQYFSSKDEVFWRIARELGRKMVVLGRSLEPVTPDADGVAALTGWIDEFASLYQQYAPIFKAFQSASRDNLDLARESSAFSERLDVALLRAFGRGTSRKDRALASAIAAVLIRCTFYWDALSAGEAVTRERLTAHLARFTHLLFYGPLGGVNTGGPGGPPDREPATPSFSPLPTAGASRALRARGHATRQALLDAGAKVLPARGYHNARVSDIVSAAKVSHGSFYRYFDDKDDFFRVLAERAGNVMIGLLERFPAGDDEAELRAWLGEWFNSYRSNGGVITTWQEMQEGGDALVAYSQQVAQVIVAGLMKMFVRRRRDDPLFDALVLLALLERLPYRTHTLGFTPPTASIDAATTIIRRALLGLDR